MQDYVSLFKGQGDITTEAPKGHREIFVLLFSIIWGSDIIMSMRDEGRP